jgi:hypothetical protein
MEHRDRVLYQCPMQMMAAIFAMSIGIAGPLAAQSGVESLEDRLKSIDGQTWTETDCNSQLAMATAANAPELIYGGRICKAAGKLVESSFLLGAGQIRALSDVRLLPPATQADDQNLLPLYGMLYFGGGTAGVEDEVLRQPAAREEFILLLDNWQPSYSSTYDPGWGVRKRPDVAQYHSTLAELKSEFRQRLDRTIRLVSDDEYYALHRRFVELLENHPHGLAAETPEGKLARELQRRSRERAIALGVEVGPPPPDLDDPEDVERHMAEARGDFPPHTPDRNETILSASTDPAVEHCLDLAERLAVTAGGSIVRVSISSSPKWGTIWRADIAGADDATRFTCTQRTSSSSPMSWGDESIPPSPVSTDSTE